MTSSAYYRHQASTLVRLAKMTPNPARAAALLLLANERLALANQREPQSTQEPPNRTSCLGISQYVTVEQFAVHRYVEFLRGFFDCLSLGRRKDLSKIFRCSTEPGGHEASIS